MPAASIEEAERVASWMELPGVRLIEIEGDWAWPSHVGLASGELEQLVALTESSSGLAS